MGVQNPPPDRGSITRLKDGELDSWLNFQFNPTSFRRQRGAKWTMHMPPGGILPLPQHGAAKVETINFALFLDSRESAVRAGVQYQLAWLESLTIAQQGELDEAITQFQAPPLLMLTLGPRLWYVVVDTLDIKEEMFDLALVPIRATVAVSMSVVFAGSSAQEQSLLDLQSAGLRAPNVLSASEVASELTFVGQEG